MLCLATISPAFRNNGCLTPLNRTLLWGFDPSLLFPLFGLVVYGLVLWEMMGRYRRGLPSNG